MSENKNVWDDFVDVVHVVTTVFSPAMFLTWIYAHQLAHVLGDENYQVPEEIVPDIIEPLNVDVL